MSSASIPASYPQEYVLKGSLDDLCHDPGGKGMNDSVPMVVTGRKTWKALKGRSEAVWPSFLEAALIEALERYRPHALAGTKLVGRFPRRNRFISNYIFSTTGKRRTPKQVGSRLQQIKETCSEPYILDLVLKREFPVEAEDIHELSVPSPCESTPSPLLASDHTHELSMPSPRQPVPFLSSASDVDEFVISASPTDHDSDWEFPNLTFSAPQVRVCLRFIPDSPWMLLESTPDLPSDILSGASSRSPLSVASSKLVTKVDPQVTFASSLHVNPSDHYCTFRVFSGETTIHTETTSLVAIPDRTAHGEQLYSTQLLPKYWSKICNDRDASGYTVMQDVKKIATQSGSSDRTLLSIHYFFDSLQTPITTSQPTSQPVSQPPYSSTIPSDSGFSQHGKYSWPRDVGRSSSSQMQHIFDPGLGENQPSNGHPYQSIYCDLPPVIASKTEYDYVQDVWLFDGRHTQMSVPYDRACSATIWLNHSYPL